MTVKVGMTRSRSYEIDPEEWKETKWTDEVHYDEQESNVSITFYSGCSPSSKGITLVAGTVEGDLLQYWGEYVTYVPDLGVVVHRILAEIADFLDIHPRHLLPLERKVIDDLPAIILKERGEE